jgi:hypothetical protein
VNRNPVRILLAIVMDILIAVAVADTLRLAFEFFGQFASKSWGKAIVAFTNPLVASFGFHSIKTPYGGVFDVNAAVMIGLFLVLEWVLSGVRGRAD